MNHLLYIILFLGILWYVFPNKEPFIGKYINPSLNKNTRYFREKRNQFGEYIGGIIKGIKRAVK